VGSTTPSTALAAIAASNAFPPFFSISRATWVASGCDVAAMPFLAMTSDLVANSLPVTLSCAKTTVESNIKTAVNVLTFIIYIIVWQSYKYERNWFTYYLIFPRRARIVPESVRAYIMKMVFIGLRLIDQTATRFIM
jgi:hypothetical protein